MYINANGLLITKEMMSRIVSISSRPQFGIKPFYKPSELGIERNILVDCQRNIYYQTSDKTMVYIGYVIRQNDKICFVDQRTHMTPGTDQNFCLE